MHSVLQAFLAQTAQDGGSPPSMLANPIFMFAAMAAVFYFVLWRPQARERKRLQQYVAALKKGDEVVTQSGIIGTVWLVEDRVVTLDVGSGTKLRVVKAQIAGQWRAVETQPAKAEAKK
ncbi:MAG TPA: preprotein translocase subunit YajC [Anaeromyxobacter sp.]|nr:preprotein translocase subunit YajC [Anaeromyxobacter sp.]